MLTDLNWNQLTNGNLDAQSFLGRWGKYLRAVDNIMDEGWNDSAHVLEALALGVDCYSSKFYQEHVSLLQSAALSTTSLWEQSVHWERQDVLWKKQWSDVLRHADVIMLGIVVMICSGWERMTSFTTMFLNAAYIDHKDRRGLPQ